MSKIENKGESAGIDLSQLSVSAREKIIISRLKGSFPQKYLSHSAHQDVFDSAHYAAVGIHVRRLAAERAAKLQETTVRLQDGRGRRVTLGISSPRTSLYSPKGKNAQ